MTAYNQLMTHVRDTLALKHVSGLLQWDQETMMPAGASGQRAECIGALSSIIHERDQAPEVQELLKEIDTETLDNVSKAKIRELRRNLERKIRIPADLARAFAETTSRAMQIWADARSRNDSTDYLPILNEIINLSRQIGESLTDNGHVYDQLLAEYEPGITTKLLDTLFNRLRPGLITLRERLLDIDMPYDQDERIYDKDSQLRLARELAETFGYNFSNGRLDCVQHPFCSGDGTDVRITTRINETDPFECLYSTIHETGHATYEANVSREYTFTPIGGGVSMGVHESQSRLYENQLGRSRGFTKWLLKRMSHYFQDYCISNPDRFYATINKLKKGYIRTEADEVQYNLHIMLRYKLERMLIEGDLTVNDLETAWNKEFFDCFGFEVDCPSNGFLQDVHWSAGLFGYFPTYALGNIYAGCLYQAITNTLGDLDPYLEKGNTEPITVWLKTHLHKFGGLREPRETIEFASGMEISERPLCDYLANKYSEIYSISD